MFFAKSRAATAGKKSIERLYYTQTLTIPGYSDPMFDNPLVFVQPSELYAPGGIKVDAILMRSRNDAFIAQHGAYYFVVSNEFAKLANKMQLGILKYEAVRSNFDVELTFGMTYDEVYDLTHAFATEDRPMADHANVDAVEAVAGTVGKSMAIKIGKRISKQEMAAAKRNAVVVDVVRDSRIKSRINAPYQESKAVVKAAATVNKTAAKNVQHTAKQIKNMPQIAPGGDPLESAAEALRVLSGLGQNIIADARGRIDDAINGGGQPEPEIVPADGPTPDAPAPEPAT